MDGITATSGSELAGINSNYGDSATFTNIVVSDVDDICVTYTGTDDNSQEPSENGSGADGTYCIYSDSDISGDTSGSSSGSSAAASQKTTSTKSSSGSKTTAASSKSTKAAKATSTKTSSSSKSTKSSSSKSSSKDN
jgi:septal ring-binding cell division protein DamX